MKTNSRRLKFANIMTDNHETPVYRCQLNLRILLAIILIPLTWVGLLPRIKDFITDMVVGSRFALTLVYYAISSITYSEFSGLNPESIFTQIDNKILLWVLTLISPFIVMVAILIILVILGGIIIGVLNSSDWLKEQYILLMKRKCKKINWDE